MQVIAHRGSNREATENTRDAFEQAVLAGSDRIELDLQITHDKQIVIFHDGEIHGQKINAMSLKEVQATFKKLATELLTIDEVLEEFGNRIELNLEIKPQHSHIPTLLKKKLGMYPLKPIIISSFYPEPLKDCSELEVPAKNAFLWEPLSADHRGKNGFVHIMHELQCNIFHPHCDMVDANLMDIAKKNNWLIYPWVAMAGEQNPEALWSKLFKLGVDGLCTNLPKELKLWLKDRA